MCKGPPFGGPSNALRGLLPGYSLAFFFFFFFLYVDQHAEPRQQRSRVRVDDQRRPRHPLRSSPSPALRGSTQLPAPEGKKPFDEKSLPFRSFHSSHSPFRYQIPKPSRKGRRYQQIPSLPFRMSQTGHFATGRASRNGHPCPLVPQFSEARISSLQARLRASESNGHRQLHDSSAVNQFVVIPGHR